MLDRIRTEHGLIQTVAPAHETDAVARPLPMRRLWWAAIVLLGLATGAVSWTIWQLRNDAIRAAISDIGNIAGVLANQLSRSLQSVDQVLLDIKRTSRDYAVSDPQDFRAAYGRKEVHDALKSYLPKLPHVFNIVIADEHGQLVTTTAAWPTPNINISDREYFQDARQRTDGQLTASIPIRNRIDGSQTIVFARRIENDAGKFAGIVFASVNFRYFESIYGSTEAIPSLIFTLVRQDGIILFRHPDTRGFIGERLSSDAMFREAMIKGHKGYRILARADGNVRYVSAQQTPGYPLFVNISVTETTALASWVRRSATIGLGSAVLLLCSIYLLIAITRQMRSLSISKESLTEKSQQLDAALNNMSQGLIMFDSENRLVVCNRQYAEMYRLAPVLLQPGISINDIGAARVAVGTGPLQNDFLPERLETIGTAEPYVAVDRLLDGRMVSITHQRMANGSWVALHQDITSQKRIEAELAHMARYDALTGLANRALFLEKVEEAFARMRRFDERFSVLMVDLDRFKEVNDSLGHVVGDGVLTAMADRLRKCVRDVDSVARLGGDEFAVIQAAQAGQRDGAIVLANRILQAITEPYDVEGRKVVIGTSIGITLAPDDGDDGDALIRNADLALYKAKSEGRNCFRFFEPSMQAHARERRELEQDLRRSISNDEFELHYQTVIDMSRGECCGAEALVRWRHRERGLLYPDQFITIAEESGLIVPLGAWILRRACADAARWPAPLKVAVNLSPMQFKQNDLLATLKSALAESGLPASRLELEITETILIEKNEENLALLHELKRLGVSIVLDDFGIGYSSMRYLQMFPFDKIKIDKSFIQSMTNHADSAAIVSAITGLGRSLDVETTAEGVETVEQFTFLRSAGCQLAQGYLFSRPVPLAKLSFERPEALRSGVKAA
jgi:diguanylate cyclase (GGDEF)-like protein